MANSSDMLRFVVIGVGEIACNQHIPIILERSNCSLRAVVDVDITKTAPVPLFRTFEEAVAAFPDINAAVICTPPEFSHDYIRKALDAGINVFAEKPPGSDHEALGALEKLARDKETTFFTAYHSTVCPAIEDAKEWISKRELAEISFQWKESARKWHRGQVWITRGYGVLDIVCNPISILEELLGPSISVVSSELLIPGNWESPISGTTRMASESGCSILATYAWNHEEEDIWTMKFVGKDGSRMEIRDGGAQMYQDGERVTQKPTAENKIRPEYEQLYSKFESVVEKHECLVRSAPLRLLNDILRVSHIERTEDYDID
eukprot:TRINITY_DN65303_c0_g1_i1.p1 TRINITY_DN65303_c0_g1~~TRINITY_DN65303_c0_g1_i1.p1  ORF type:complete len:320 (+),score=28.46 TRINITY_DN65303_c0_g1_i1:132-1091(+)